MAPKQKPNGFLLFMLEFKKREERKGRVFKEGLKDIQADPQCNKEWQSMNPEKKAEFNRRAKNQKQSVGKKTGTGEYMDAVERERRKKVDFEHNMNDDIESIVAMGMEFGNLPQIKFNFIHANWFYTRALEDGSFDYIPAEFAVSEFSLEQGVTEVYHKIIKTEIRCGYTREAMETSQETHQLPWNLKSGEDRFDVMCTELQEFLNSNKTERKFPPLYTSRKIHAAVKALIKRLTKSMDLSEDTFVIYDLEVLFTHLRNAALQKNDQLENFKTVMAEYELIKDAFSFTPGLDCDYHKNFDGTSQFCSMSIVKRWAFTICDYCCENLGIEMRPGVHLPLKIDPEFAFDAMNGLAEQISSLEIQDLIGIKSMTGVSKEYRTKVSERTNAEEQRRRNDKSTVTVINYAKRVAEQDSEPAPVIVPPTSGIQEYQRPLRLPNTKSHAHVLGQNQQGHSYNESDFPSLGVSAGRGSGAKRQQNETKPSAGRGRGIALS